ncbi:MAG: S8 family serine peptidase [Acidobacteria bacterium]|nr:S8 family serine peptidase [Acidobacteriota bacterium]
MRSGTLTAAAAVLIGALILPAAALAADDRASAGAESPAARTWEEARDVFFTTIDQLLARNPRSQDIGGKDMAALLDARKQIPYLFERVMLIAWQKHEPEYSEWLRKGDEASLARFHGAFIALARDYAGRFVGSLFRTAETQDFESALPHNRGKSRLDLVLQSLGFNARNDLPDVPKEKWFTNAIAPDYRAHWTLDAVNARPVAGSPTGKGVVVAVLDSGLDPYNSLFKDRTVPGFSFLRRTRPPWEQEDGPTIDWGYHGTVTASTVLLVAPEATIMPVRVFDGDTMNDPVYDYWLFELIAAGVYYAVHHGAHVIQIGAALQASQPVVAEAVRDAYYHNVVISSSAGNISRAFFGIDPAKQLYRAFDTEVLLAGGVQKEGDQVRPWPHTVPNTFMDVVTPSQDVYVIAPVYAPDLKDSYVAGTSLSSPILSGVIALMRSAAPPPASLLAQPAAYARLVAKCVRETASLSRIGLVERNDSVGEGLLDATAAIGAARRALAPGRKGTEN